MTRWYLSHTLAAFWQPPKTAACSAAIGSAAVGSDGPKRTKTGKRSGLTMALLLNFLGILPMIMPSHSLAATGNDIMQKGGANPTALPCTTCHGADGKGNAEAGFPRLAGLPAPYLAKQLHDFRSGKRDNALMKSIAGALTDEEINLVTRAYAERQPVNIIAKPDLNPEPGSGAWLALRGAWERNIPECTLCHGPSGIGVGDSFPPLAAQSPIYLENQLMAWRPGKTTAAKNAKANKKPVPATRNNDPNGLMQHIALSLTEAEIKAVAQYFGSLGDSTESFDQSQYRLR